MKIICHRGNTFGPDPENENKPEVIDYCIREGFDVEIDLWVQGQSLYLGHDGPQHSVDWEYLHHHKHHLWVHAKNLDALMLLNSRNFNYFWHEDDDYTITSKGFIWTHPNTVVTNTHHKQILLDFDRGAVERHSQKYIGGVCVDYV